MGARPQQASEAQPATVSWAIGLSVFHALLAGVFVLVALNRGAGGAAWLSWGFGVAWTVTAAGLRGRNDLAWKAAVVLSSLSILFELIQLRFGVSTSLAILILLLTPSARGWFGVAISVAPVPQHPLPSMAGPPRELVRCPRCLEEVPAQPRVCGWCGAPLFPDE